MNTNFQKHIFEQPAGVENILLNSNVRALDAARPIRFVGIGTSWHAARVAEYWIRKLSAGAVDARAITANDFVLTEPVSDDQQIVVISHRGTKRFPNAALAKANAIGCDTVAITGSGSNTPDADVVIRTCEQERAATHTVSYTSALMVLAKLVTGTLSDAGRPLAQLLPIVSAKMSETLSRDISPQLVDLLLDTSAYPGIISGAGLGLVTASEAALKIKEGTYQWVEAMDFEFALHGTPAIFRPGMVACLIDSTEDEGRMQELAAVLRHIGARVIICGSQKGADMPVAHHNPLIGPFIEILPFQRLVHEISIRNGANPDLTHIESEPWKSAFSLATL